jgi:hypothetical protein
MGKRSNFTEAQVARAVRAARRVDPSAVIEVTREGTIRILPAESEKRSEVDRWFAENGDG